ncbi:unnamed protein product [Vitrella brassicaformis CCMP3155]|uniref:Major facilitator superfamily (MFS) profile domain-containing protein n=1 Tax=Vitrella brassicaformis (strain CCMP3155) TaxID=1169540 RepID=A0A0G4EDA7_VITBC|nr:unnamed protein product [Vitrella brassicaformis CCMP3155]|mmetsp:Transcript_47376/g.118340  ORF Transcript_47376/g.118340 Transcript_47376/m.118340 type:complete len:453 (-) Transcript_47376:850-2208(-)|eukprot:CEL93328.1 unnamed protein product [Vitrella brassicaformis CCMP3155]
MQLVHFHSPKSNWQRWMPVIGGFLVHMTLGTMHCFGNLTIYMTSYLREEGGEDLRYKDTIWIYAASIVSQGLFGTIGGQMEGWMGPRLATLVGGWLMSAGVALSYYTAHSFIGLILTYGVLCGIGCGLCYPVPLACALKWQPDRKGLVSGIIFVGRGMAVFLFQPLQMWWVNPWDETPDFAPDESKPTERYYTAPDVLDRVPTLFLALGGTFAAIQLLGALMLSNPPDEDRDEPRKFLSEQTSGIGLSMDLQLSTGQLLCSFAFWLLWLMMFFNWQAVAFSQVFWKVLGFQDVDNVMDSRLTILGSVAWFLNTVGRVFWGTLGDRCGFKCAMSLMCLLMSVFIGTITLAAELGGFWAYAVWMCVIFMAHGGAFAIFPAVTADTFGKKNFGPAFGLLFTARAVASIVHALGAQYLIDTSGVHGMAEVVAACTFVSLLLALVFKPSYYRRPAAF